MHSCTILTVERKSKGNSLPISRSLPKLSCGTSTYLSREIHDQSSLAPDTVMASKPNPLSLNDTLRDLALLRACDVDFSALVAQPAADEQRSEADASVDRSYEFVREARAALKVLNRGEVEQQGERVESIRGTLEDVAQGLEAQS